MPARRALIHCGDVWDAELAGVGVHPFVVVSRDAAIPVLSQVVGVLVTSTRHGHVAEVELGREEGLGHDSAVNADTIFTIPKADLVRRRGRLGPVKLRQLEAAVRIALEL